MTSAEYCTLTELAQDLVGQTSHTVGKALKKAGYRQPDGAPSPQAKSLGFVYLTAGPQPWIPLWLWHHERTLELLVGWGMVRKGENDA